MRYLKKRITKQKRILKKGKRKANNFLSEHRNKFLSYNLQHT